MQCMPLPTSYPVVSADLAALLATLLMAQQLPPSGGVLFNTSAVNVSGVVVTFRYMAGHTSVKVTNGPAYCPLVDARITRDLAEDLWKHCIALPGAKVV